MKKLRKLRFLRLRSFQKINLVFKCNSEKITIAHTISPNV